MHMELRPALVELLQHQVSSGNYPSAEAVVEEALMDWQAKEDERAQSRTRSDRMRELFERFDAEGGAEFELERDTSPVQEREWF